MSITTENVDFHDAFKFVIEIEGVVRAAFKSCSALAGEFEVIEHREGGRDITYKSPGTLSFPDVTLERGVLDDDDDLYDWWLQISNVAVDSPLGGGLGTGVGAADDTFRRTVDIVQLGRDKTPRKRWRLFRAWIKRFQAGEWSDANDKVMEQVVLTYEYFVRADP